MDKKISDRSSSVKTYHQEPLAEPEFLPKTAFGRELWGLRRKALAEGLRLMDNNEILAEIEARRYGKPAENYDCPNLY